ncbi:MAG: DUF5717 family protein [Lachnospiraceae bacterium]|nr:DUF5717 family protein [Lachnospiraceae bacterium]
MKRRIEQLLNGIFEYSRPELAVWPQEITILAEPGTAVRGSFRLESSDHRKIKGFLYTSSPRVICEPVEFQGLSNEIHYQADCSGFAAGTQEEGIITVCSDLGEHEIPYRIQVREQECNDKESDITDMAEFVLMAQRDFDHAYRVFVSPSFRRFIQEKETGLSGLYDGLMAGQVSQQSLEEFLISAGQKMPVEISVEETFYDWGELTGPVRETLQLTRNTWGFQKIKIESDARFLRPEKRSLSADEFAGSTYDLNLIVDTNLMHAGTNYARLQISSGLKTISIEVRAQKAGNAAAVRSHHICKIMQKELEALYVSFRLKRIDLTTWVERSVSVINSYRRAGGNDPFAELFLVQLYFADGKKQKAYKILESLENQKYRLNTPERYGFYLYMSTFFYHEASYVDRVEEEISRMFFRDKTNWKLQWILLYLKESLLSDDNAKYEVIAEQFRYGCRSRIMYLEAYEILKNNPFLMRHLGAYELGLLRFAAREEILTAEIIRQAAGLTVHHGRFDQRLYEILTSGYQLYPSSDLVKAICILLMKGDKKDSCYFPWYAKGVEDSLRITGLYEYYMETMDSLDMKSMPQVIRMYFAYDNTLDYRKRAGIYRNIIENRDADAQTYHNYRVAIERFAIDQLEAGRISDDLAVIYKTFLKRNILTKPMAEKLIKVLFSYEVTCNAPHIRKLILHSEHLVREQSVIFSEGKATISIYDPNSVLLVEDDRGCRYQADALCLRRRLFGEEDMLAWCAEKAPEYPGLLLYLCSQCLEAKLVNDQTLPYFRKASERREFSEEFRTKMRREVLEYYVNHMRDDSLPEFLESIPYLEYVAVDKAALITLLAEEGKCADAFSLLDAYGSEGIPLLQLVRICSRMVLELEFEENTMLVALCHFCFSSGKYDDKLLRYLLLYYEGPVQEMKLVWQAAVKFDLDTMLLEEKILMMILFTRSGSQGSEPVFEAYVKKMGRKRICKAYVNLKAYEYFVKGIPVADSVFQYIEREYGYLEPKGRLDEQEEVCRLALLQYYAKKVELTQERRARTAKMLEEFGAKGMRFAFWQRFDRELLAPYQMEGRVFAEYACNPESVVHIHYRIRGREETYTKEAVKNYFEGIFVREFTLFAGEELECYLEEELDGETKKSDKIILTAAGSPDGGNSKYGFLNRISRAQQQSDKEALYNELEAYFTLEYLTQEVFTLV